MNTKPSPYLPEWALRWFEAHRAHFDAYYDPNNPDNPDRDWCLAHRHAAFYRLFCADSLRSLWKYADRSLADDEHGQFLSAVIYGTDSALEAEPVPRYQRPQARPEQRLRDPAQRLARKLARLLDELRLVTPGDCQARQYPSPLNCMGGELEALVIFYRFELEPLDVNATYRKHGIEYTSDSKRGWLQRRRASDAVRIRVIEAMRKLATIGRTTEAARLRRIAAELERLPDLKTEHGDQPELRSQKTGWADWLRIAHEHANAGRDHDCLRHADWADLVGVLFDEHVTERRIGQVLGENALPS